MTGHERIQTAQEQLLVLYAELDNAQRQGLLFTESEVGHSEHIVRLKRKIQAKEKFIQNLRKRYGYAEI